MAAKASSKHGVKSNARRTDAGPHPSALLQRPDIVKLSGWCATGTTERLRMAQVAERALVKLQILVGNLTPIIFAVPRVTNPSYVPPISRSFCFD